MKEFTAVLREMCDRPAVYVGHISIRALSHYVAGYCHAVRDAGHPDPLEGWQSWVEKKFLISSAAWHWSRILVHEYGGDEAALGALPGLYKEFEEERSRVGVDGIEAERRRQLVERFGRAGHRPPESITTEPWFTDPA